MNVELQKTENNLNLDQCPLNANQETALGTIKDQLLNDDVQVRKNSLMDILSKLK